MHKFIPLSVPNLCGNELKYVTETIESEWVSTGGAQINVFENELAKFVNVDHAIACQSGSAGLHLALIETGVKRDEEVIVPALTFIAAVNPVKYVGANPIFMDCDDSLCMDPVKLLLFLEKECIINASKEVINLKTNKVIRTIIVVHVFGNIADMESIMDIAIKYGLKVIEDSTEALGSVVNSGKYSGMFAGTIGDIGVYSFNGNKIITTGGGGMIVSRNETMLNHMKYLSTQAKDDVINFIHNEIGYNYRMTNLQAAMGIAQLENLPTFIDTKKKNYFIYKKELDEIEGCTILDFSENVSSNYWFYSLYVDKEGFIVDDLIHYLDKMNIQTRPIWGLINEQVPYKDAEKFEIVKANEYLKHVINIPCSTNLKTEDVHYIIDVIKKYFEG